MKECGATMSQNAGQIRTKVKGMQAFIQRPEWKRKESVPREKYI
jgi:hypothetical protein